ncbi:amino acid/amide ABC transporter substrate-binding protein, HAAT family [Rhizobiales bacterium GAS188]|nr:amino acid/amide ABC transporter substrate-binding protein, HAAT family [Rhizobiales bacterium GAS188]
MFQIYSEYRSNNLLSVALSFAPLRLICVAVGVGISVMSLTPAAFAEPGVSNDRILFGQAAALDGPAGALGRDVRTGILAAFAEVNRTGGVRGHLLELVSRDDGYEPTKSIDVTKTLINDDKVFALVGAVGTPTSLATEPIAAENNVPFIGPFTGAEFLRGADKTNVVNVRASYFQETETMVERLTKDKGVTRIAILYQDDAFGRAGLAGIERALDRRGMRLVSEGTFERNTTAVKMALLAIRKGDPEAVIMIGPYQPCAAFIKLARQLKMNATFVNISFVGSNSLAKELGADGAGVIITQVVPFPWDAVIPVVERYQAALKSVDPAREPGFVTFEGYVIGRLVIAALQKIPGELTRKAMLDAIFGGEFDFQGVKLAYSIGHNQGGNEVFLTEIQADGSFKPLQSLRGVGN